jgi:hypothetical protein
LSIYNKRFKAFDDLENLAKLVTSLDVWFSCVSPVDLHSLKGRYSQLSLP